MKKSVVLLSGGMDSTVNLYQAKQSSQVVLALTFDYGQKAGQKEIEATKKMTKDLGIAHRILSLEFIREFGGSSLTTAAMEIPSGKQVSIDDMSVSQKTARSVWVPNRNGIFLNVAAGFAESLRADWIIPGFNKEEATTFPDNSKEYLETATKSLSYSTHNQVQVKCFTTDLDKIAIVKLGQQLKVNWKNIWPCYKNLEKWCGQCESCQRSWRAFRDAGVDMTDLFMGEN
jgi:7-cyano-7-deazaguanine synthase